jgi:hypothetical protein
MQKNNNKLIKTTNKLQVISDESEITNLLVILIIPFLQVIFQSDVQISKEDE